jgi:hypothetical protein
VSDETTIQTALSYLRQNRDQYELEALRQQLLAAGYPSAAVDAAVARLQADEGATPTPEPLPVAAPATPDVLAGEITAQPEVSTLAEAERERLRQQMLGYLREHGGRYELEALRQQLLAAGQDPGLVEEAIARAGVTGPPPVERAWPLGLGIAAINIFALPFVFGALGSLAGGSDSALIVVGLLPLLVLVGELVAGLLLLNGPRRRLGKALLWGLLFSFAIPLILGVLLIGVCLVIIAGIGSFGP